MSGDHASFARFAGSTGHGGSEFGMTGSPRVYRLMDLFSGAGGLTLGFTKTGHFRSVFAVEFDEDAAQTYAENFNHAIVTIPPGSDAVHIADDDLVYHGDIRKLASVGFSADVIIGGPPCQGFSPLGRMSPRAEHQSMNQLWQDFMRLVHHVRPLAFVIENVPELLRSREYRAIELVARSLGYNTAAQVLKAVDYGVPQRRVRAFIMGLLGGIQPELPQPSGFRQSVRDAIGDLPPQPSTMEVKNLEGRPKTSRRQDLHVGRSPTPISEERYRLIEPGENRFALARKAPHLTPRCWLDKRTGSTDVFGRLKWDEPAYTIRTEFFKPEKGCYLHPEQHRPITHREAARLQTFDDWFFFHGSKIQIAKQIGNAVPPRLAEAVAAKVAKFLPEVENRLANGWTPPEVDFNEILRDALDIAYDRRQQRLQFDSA